MEKNINKKINDDDVEKTETLVDKSSEKNEKINKTSLSLSPYIARRLLFRTR